MTKKHTTYEVDFYWKDDPETLRTVSVAKGTSDMTEGEYDALLDLDNGGAFFVFNHDEEIIGDHGEFVITGTRMEV